MWRWLKLIKFKSDSLNLGFLGATQVDLYCSKGWKSMLCRIKIWIGDGSGLKHGIENKSQWAVPLQGLPFL